MKFSSKGDVIILEDITNGYPGLSEVSGSSLLESCIVTLHRSNHKSGVNMDVSGIEEKKRLLIWSKSHTPQLDRTWKDQKEATEKAAVCLSLLLALKYTSFTIIERAVIGTGFDYWLGNDTNDPDIFDKKARLEISGIFKGDNQTIEERVKLKVNQTKQSEKTLLPACISVIEFSTPKSKFIVT